MTAANNKARSLELRTLAADILAASGADVTQAVDRGQMRKMIDELVRRGNCHQETARAQIARAIRRARHADQPVSTWGGSRPGSGRLPKEHTMSASDYVYGWYHYANGADKEFRYPASRSDDLKQDGAKVTVEIHAGGTHWTHRRGVVVWGGGNYTVIPA